MDDDLPAGLRTAFELGGEMGRRMAAHDWSTSPLGHPSTWPPELVAATITMLASKTQIVLFYGPQYAALYNDAYIPTMGVKHPAYLGRSGRDMWSETWDVIQLLFDQVVRSNEGFWAANHPFMLERHGFLEETYFDISYDPIRLADATVGGVLCIVSDTTARVLGERRLATLSALGSGLAEAADQHELADLVTGRLTANAADVPWAALYLDDGDSGPLALAGCAGRPPEQCWPLTGETRTAAQDVLADGGVRELPGALALPVGGGTGRIGVLLAGVSPLLALDQAYRDFFDLAAAQISRAVGNLRAYEQERRRAADLAALDQAKTNFFSNVSHEFRTPLTLILGPLEDLLADPALADGPRERLTTVHRNGLRLLKLVNTVLDFSRMESGRLRAAYQPTDLADYTARLASTFRSAAERAGLTLNVDCPPLPEAVVVDRDQWEKIVLNLLSNAVKHTPRGSIDVVVRAVGDAAQLSVTDTGIGVAADELPYLFDRFHRVVGAWSRSHEGTGIGLALVRELTELHGGTVAAASTPGLGSTFTVTIPFGDAHLPAERVEPAAADAGDGHVVRGYVDEAHWWTDLGDRSTGDGDGGQRLGHILLADDNPDLRDHVARLLRPYWEVTTVRDGQEAVDAALTGRYDLIVTDVMMPRLDGFGVVRALRADERTREVPIMMLTARAGEESAVEGWAAGADDYLTKPFSAKELLARVRSAVELGQLRGQTVNRLRGLVDAAAALASARTTGDVLQVAAAHVEAMTGAGRVVVTVPGARFEVDGGAEPGAQPATVLPLPDTTGAPLGELLVFSGDRTPDVTVLTQLARLIGQRLANARLYEAEHRIAATLQHSLLPQSLPRLPGAVLASRYLPGSSEAEVGGDWYDVVVPPGSDSLVLVIGDVVGKGVHAAAGMGQLRNALRAYILEGFEPGAALTRLNRLVDTGGHRQFATVVCVGFHPASGRLRYSSAGHPAPVVALPGGAGEFLHEQALGPPIGALAQAVYPTREAVLAPGRRLLLYTDGLVEDRRRGIDAGLADLCAAVARPADHVEDLLDELLATAARRDRRDDIALLAVEATDPRRFVLRLAADPARLTVLRRRLEGFLVGHDVAEDDVFDLTFAVSEAAANAIEHPVDATEASITVEVSIDDTAVTATVRDTGSWRPETDAGFRGRGLALIGALAELTVDRAADGTAVTLRRELRR